MPQMGESLTEGTLVRWLKHAGDTVAIDEPLFEISTDKVDAEVPSPVAGRLHEQLVREGETVSVGTAVALVASQETQQPESTSDVSLVPVEAQPREEPGGHFKSSHAAQLVSFNRLGGLRAAVSKVPVPPVASAAQPAPRSTEVTESDPRHTRPWTPAVLDVARRGGIPLDALTAITGSGRGGRVTKRDVERFLRTSRSGGEPSRSPFAAHAAADVPAEYVYRPGPEDRLEPMTPTRRRIAQHMAWSVRISPHATAFAECDMSAAAAIVTRERAARTSHESPLTFTVLVAEAVVGLLRDFPVLNASVVGDTIAYKPYVNLGIAVALTDGDELVVPVIRRANELARSGLARAIADLAARARERCLTLDDVQGGTFTLTNPGVFGGISGTPLLHQPQVAILGLGAVTKRAVVIDEAIAIRPMLWLSLTIDHRATDGMTAFRFLDALRRRLESLA